MKDLELANKYKILVGGKLNAREHYFEGTRGEAVKHATKELGLVNYRIERDE